MSTMLRKISYTSLVLTAVDRLALYGGIRSSLWGRKYSWPSLMTLRSLKIPMIALKLWVMAANKVCLSLTCWYLQGPRSVDYLVFIPTFSRWVTSPTTSLATRMLGGGKRRWRRTRGSMTSKQRWGSYNNGGPVAGGPNIGQRKDIEKWDW